jgi:quercetin dioxygenase-like cupin family protein
MKIFRFDRETGRAVDRFNSSGFVLTNIAFLLEEVNLHYAYLEPQGVIGYHKTQMPQLFLVVQGDGWVKGESPERTTVQAGQAVHWKDGEWHEIGTETGMTAIILEAQGFDESTWVHVA